MRIYVTGAGGLLGAALLRAGARGWTHAELDVTDRRAAARALDVERPDAVIFCAAITDVDRCTHDPAAEAVNVGAPAWWAARVPTWLVSTNYVFGGAGPHRPDDPRGPVNAYGAQKARAEAAVLAAGGHVVRTGWLFGPGGRNFPSRIGQLLRRGTVRAACDLPVQPTWADDLAARLLELPRGVHHLVGEETTTWAGFARAAARHLGLPPDRVVPVPADELGWGPRPRDARLAPAMLPGWSRRLPLLLGPP